MMARRPGLLVFSGCAPRAAAPAPPPPKSTAPLMASLPAPRTFSYEELLLSAEGRLFGPAAPRLPLPPMLMLDRVTRAAAEGGPHGAGEIAAEKDIAP